MSDKTEKTLKNSIKILNIFIDMSDKVLKKLL